MTYYCTEITKKREERELSQSLVLPPVLMGVVAQLVDDIWRCRRWTNRGRHIVSALPVCCGGVCLGLIPMIKKEASCSRLLSLRMHSWGENMTRMGGVWGSTGNISSFVRYAGTTQSSL